MQKAEFTGNSDIDSKDRGDVRIADRLLAVCIGSNGREVN